MGRQYTGWMFALAVAFALVLGACGSSSSNAGSDSSDAGTPTTESGDTGSSGSTGDASILVAVNSKEYPVTTVQKCNTTGDAASNQDLAVYGYAESGERVELTFMHQSAETSPSGQVEYYGGLDIASGSGGHWQSQSTEPWLFLSRDRSNVVGTVTMEDSEGQPAEIFFTVACG